MKKNLKYEVLAGCMDMNEDGLMEYREQVGVFRKGGINHIARIVTYVDLKKGKTPKLVSLLTNVFDMSMETIVAIYRRRWQIETLFKQKTAYEVSACLVGSEMCIRDSYEKFEELTERNVVYVTRMKKNLKYEAVSYTHLTLPTILLV